MDNPFCFECGYDLTGLELPRPCPECGRFADPAAQVAEAREWFEHRSARLKWLVRPQTVPSGLWYALSDVASAKLARRRVACWLWLPAILAVVTVGLGCFLTAEYDVKIWYYERSDTERTPVRAVTESETDRLFAFNLHFWRGGFFFNKPESWVEVVERRLESVGVSTPEYMAPMFLIWGCGPLLAVVFGYLPSRKLVLGLARHRALKQRQIDLTNATQTAWSVMSIPLGIGTWVWLLAAWVHAVTKLSGLNGIVGYFVAGLLCVAAGWWVVVSLIGYAVLVRQDRGRIVVGSRIGLWSIAAGLSIGGPVAVGWFLSRVFW